MQDFLNAVCYEISHETYFLRILTACICGFLIGYERSRRQKDAGIRTHVMVALGSALVMVVSKYGFIDSLAMGMNADATRIASNVVTGVGFLGAGTIFVKDVSIKGLTTAAGIWATAGIGLALGAGMYTLGITATVFMVIFQFVLHKYFSRLENTSNEFTVVLVDKKGSVNVFKEKLAEKNITIEKCKMTRNHDSTISLDVTVKKARTISMDEIMLLMEQDENIVSVDI